MNLQVLEKKIADIEQCVVIKKSLSERIADLEALIANPPKFPAEVYTRITGYYRSVNQWNNGKQEEFRQRKEYSNFVIKEREASSFIYFYGEQCPNCKPMKVVVDQLPRSKKVINANEEANREIVERYDIVGTPTLIALDQNGREMARYHDAVSAKVGLL